MKTYKITIKVFTNKKWNYQVTVASFNEAVKMANEIVNNEFGEEVKPTIEKIIEL